MANTNPNRKRDANPPINAWPYTVGLVVLALCGVLYWVYVAEPTITPVTQTLDLPGEW